MKKLKDYWFIPIVVLEDIALVMFYIWWVFNY